MKNSHKHIQVIASSITGIYHKNNSLPCQDCHKFVASKNKLVAVVSDGAGSAKYGKIGAKIVCETLCDILNSSSFTDIKQKIIYAIEVARKKLVLHRFNKYKNENGIIDFAATVVGVFYYKKIF